MKDNRKMHRDDVNLVMYWVISTLYVLAKRSVTTRRCEGKHVNWISRMKNLKKLIKESDWF